MGVEGFSKPMELTEMNPILGNKREYTWMLAFFGLVPLLAYGRKSNEDGLRAEVRATNRYVRLDLDSQSRQFSKMWLIKSGQTKSTKCITLFKAKTMFNHV